LIRKEHVKKGKYNNEREVRVTVKKSRLRSFARNLKSIEKGGGQCECSFSQKVTKTIRMGLKVIS
jgi:hypothetical protein